MLFSRELLIMFTLEQINDVHDRLGKKETLLSYVRALNAIGVEKYDSYITDGHSEFVDKDAQRVESPPANAALPINDVSDGQQARKHLDLHTQGKSSYLEMSEGLADSGVEKWTVDINKMTMVFYDKQENELLVEKVS